MRPRRRHWPSALFTALVASAAHALGCGPLVELEPGDISIDRIEVTQGIQTEQNQVPLVAGKATYVRVFVRGNPPMSGAPLPAVGARLSIAGGLAIAPTGATTIVPSASGSNPRTLTDSFLFKIPPNHLGTGERRAQVDLILPPGYSLGARARTRVTHDLRFGPDAAWTHMRVYGVRYGYRNVPAEVRARFGLTNSTWPARPFDAFEPQRVGAENMLPVASLAIDRLPGDPMNEFDCRYTGDFATGGCGGYADAAPWAKRLIDAVHPEGGAWIVVLQPEYGNGHYGAHDWSAAGNHVINFQGDAPPDVGATLAHEIGHGLGLPHTFEDPFYPRPNDALGPFVALRGGSTPTLIPGEDSAGNSTGTDTMSYGFSNWFSPYNYCRALRSISDSGQTCPDGLDTWNFCAGCDYTIEFIDVDDDAAVWIDTGGSLGSPVVSVGSGTHTGVSLCPALRICGMNTIVAKIGNGGCFNSGGTIVIRKAGVEVWRHESPHVLWSHCGYTARAELTFDLPNGNAPTVVEDRFCNVPTDCMN